MRIAGRFHLTYCSNIHPGESWHEVRRNLEAALPGIRRALSAEGPFGLGLRLSARAAETLEDAAELSSFQEFLREGNYYVFTLNGFPYGAFHGTRVKEDVYLPDWLDERRVHYTNRLARILAALLPDDPALEGSISTVPGAYKPRVRSRDAERQMARLILEHVVALRRLREQTGKTISLALEPEPRCFLETVDEVVRFFRHDLVDPTLLASVRADPGGSLAPADVRRHLGVCYDACHMAVQSEEPAAVIDALTRAEIRICKVQISSALRLSFREGDGRTSTLVPFAEDTYLHQVVERSASGLTRYNDLPEALAAEATAGRSREGTHEEKEWRVHFHLPIFLDATPSFETTQDHLVTLIDLLKQNTVCPYLEVETYTWDVLPPAYRDVETSAAIARELAWVRTRLES